MNCSDVQNLIPLYCKGELSDELRRQVEEHLSGCPDCRTEKKREDMLGKTLGDGASQEPSNEYRDGYNDNVRSVIRGTVGMLWKIGELPGCLAGLVAGLVAAPIAVLLGFCFIKYFRHLHLPEHIGLGYLFIIAMVVAVVVGLIIRFTLYKPLEQRIEKKLGDDEKKLRRTIAGDPSIHTAFVSAGILRSVLLLAFLSLMIIIVTPDIPLIIRVPVGVLQFCIGLGAELPKYLKYASGSDRVFVWWQRVLAFIYMATWITMAFFNLTLAVH